MNNKQRLALTLTGSAVALGLFFHKPIGGLIERLTETPQERRTREYVEESRASLERVEKERKRYEARGYPVLTYSGGGTDNYNIILPKGSTTKRDRESGRDIVYDSQEKAIGDIRYSNPERENAARSGNPLHYEFLSESAKDSPLIFYKYFNQEEEEEK